ncbi:hypothetical protein [Chromobacterium violaceum]|uniref:hypothetical protein n=1 Tax=Chromobacterium violaceum TaxID=536 RepID=UPI0012D3440D|nr:hypothetical protein [Chromobacterium violaceum]
MSEVESDPISSPLLTAWQYIGLKVFKWMLIAAVLSYGLYVISQFAGKQSTATLVFKAMFEAGGIPWLLGAGGVGYGTYTKHSKGKTIKQRDARIKKLEGKIKDAGGSIE